MKPIRTILFPTDFSQAATEMAPYATEMAERFHSNVIVLHAFDAVRDYVLASSYEATYGSEPIVIPYTGILQELRNERQRRLEQFARDQFLTVEHAVKIVDGNPASVIELVAHNENADLIVMPTRGIGKFRRLLLGSITAKVLHDITCPVLTSAHEPAPALARTSGYRSIVCAVDLNRESDVILKAAAFLAQTYGARLCLIHMESARSQQHDEDALAESIRHAFQRTLYADGGKPRVDVKVRILEAGIPEGIRNAAAEEKADMVIVGRGHEQGNISRLWSHLYTIIRESPCPVLSV